MPTDPCGGDEIMSMKTAILSVAIAFLFMLPAYAETADIVDSYVDEETGLVFYQVESGNWGLMTAEGEVLLEPILNENDYFGYYFTDGFASVCGENGLWGVIDTAGTIVVPFQFDNISSFSEGFAVVRGDGLYGYIDTAGTLVVPYQYDQAYDFSEGLAVVKIDGYYGYIDKTGEMICDAVYTYACPFREGLASVERDDKFGFIDASGEYVIDPIYDYVSSFIDGLAIVGLLDLYGAIDPSGAVVIEIKYDDMWYFNEGLAVVELDGKCGQIDSTGAVVIPIEYDWVNNFEYGLAIAHLGDEYLLIDKTNDALLTLPGDGIDDESIYVVSADEVRVTYENEERVDYYYRTEDEFQLVTEIGSSFDITEYYPNEGEKVATQGEPSAPPDWISGAALPKIDGATALFPVYSAFVQATYPDTTRYGELITCSKTDGAYESLIAGTADVIFVAGPSDAQFAAAAEAGVEFELTPIGKEAFVFFVSRENPLTAITLDEIRGIYSGEITQWNELGVEDLGEILAYQRPENSGSQTALEKLMEGYELMEAPELYIGDMCEIVVLVEYRNLPNAIGYSFRFYVTGLMNSDVTLLSVDGVAPTVENIRSGEYPLITQLYAVTRKGEENPNVALFLDWVTSDAGMELIEKTGYVAER